METGSKKWSLSKVEIIKKLKSLAWGALYSIIIGVIAYLTDLDVPTQYAFLLPIVVVLLTNLSHTVKLYVTDTTP